MVMNGSHGARRARGLLLCACVGGMPCAHAQALSPDADEAPEIELQEVKVRERPIDPPEFDARRSVSVRDAQVLQREQPASLFEAVRDVPGIAVQGGPRASGMSFNIRGYGDGEDVQVRLDGVIKGFEKYRFGGTFIEPELLKSVEVQRGPQIASGSGALGGTVSAATRDAADLMAPGERVGARLKQAVSSNNNEDLTLVMAYARPMNRVDLLASHLRRRSNDIRLSDGSRLALSANDAESHLFKASVLPRDDLLLSLSAVSYRETGLQPYDATGGEPGFFGEVRRDIDDRTVSARLEYLPSTPLVSLKLAVGEARTALLDRHAPGKSLFANAVTGEVSDHYAYTNHTVDLTNTSTLTMGGLPLTVLAGAQWVENVRETARFRARIPSSNGGFDPSIPPGIKRNGALFVQPRLDLGPLEIAPGLRRDQYEVSATGGSAALLAALGEAERIAFGRTTSSLGLSYVPQPSPVRIFYNYAQAFRPPLVDEYFIQGAFGRCTASNLKDLAPASRVCGRLYRPQDATHQEAGASLSTRLASIGAQLDAKLTLFRVETRHLLRSIQRVSDTEVGQPGWEARRGLEFESSLRGPRGYLRLSYARMHGRLDLGGGLDRPSAPAPLYNVPGDTVSVSAGWRVDECVELGVGYQHVAARRVVLATVAGVDQIGWQDGHALWSANARLQLSDKVELRLSGENLANQRYQLMSSFAGGIGFEAPGRNLRIALVARL